MPTYLRPGVFTEDSLLPLDSGTRESGASVAAFVGTSSLGGPVGPTLVESFSQYQTLFGNLRTSRDTLAYAVYNYFNNGGTACWVVRAVNADATAATLTLNDGASAATLQVVAQSPGTWASNVTTGIKVTVTSAGTAGRFNLVIEVGSGANVTSRESFTDLSTAINDSRNVAGIVNSPTVGSKIVKVNIIDASKTPAAQVATPLTGGTEGTGTPNLVSAAALLDDTDGPLVLNLPGVSDSTTLSSVITWATGTRRVFVVCDVPASTSNANTDKTAMVNLGTALSATSFAGVYGPWVFINDPGSTVPGALRLVPVGPLVVGQIIRTDLVRGVHKAPAGIETRLAGVINAATKFSGADLDTLNDKHINVIRPVPGAGTVIMGARTLDYQTTGRYINVRRTIISASDALTNLSRFAIFEPNEPVLWEKITAVLSTYLSNLSAAGVLKGGGGEGVSYYVKCDAENNTPAEVNAGRVNIEVGLAIASPAEFVVIRIAQFDGGSSADATA